MILIFMRLFFCVVKAQNDLNELQKVHQEHMKIMQHFLTSHHCLHIYLDIGTNIGVQIRKLYQPQSYPGAAILPFFNEMFVNATQNRTNICSFGFEPNYIHTARLQQLQSTYRSMGYPTVIFTGVAVDRVTGNATFYHDVKAIPEQHEWGASLFNWQNQGQKVAFNVLTVDLAAFINNMYQHWSPPGHGVKSTPDDLINHNHHKHKGVIVAKMDIEGAEYIVLPHLLAHGTLCYIDVIMAEFHAWGMPAEQIPGKAAEKDIIKWIIKQSRGCSFTLSELDDESYFNDPIALPQVAGNSTSTPETSSPPKAQRLLKDQIDADKVYDRRFLRQRTTAHKDQSSQVQKSKTIIFTRV